jgi:protein-tyrosine-phosphatase
MAEAILKHMTSSSATKLIISSGGTGGKTALAPTDARTISTLRRHGIDLQQRAPRAVVDEDFRTFSHILAMDDSDLASLMIGDGAEVRLFGSFSRGVREVVPDPYSGGEGKFERAYQQMRRLACELLLEFGFGTGEF